MEKHIKIHKQNFAGLEMIFIFVVLGSLPSTHHVLHI